MRKITLFLLTAAILALIGCTGGPSANSVWRVGLLDTELPPLFFQDEQGNLTGFEVDLLSEVAQRLGKKIEYVKVTNEYEKALKEKTVDVVWGNVLDTEEARKALLLTNPYLKTNQVAVVAKDSGIETKEDLNGKELLTVMWTPADQYSKDGTFGIEFVQIRGFGAYQTTFDSLKDKTAVAVLCDETMAEYMIEKLGDQYIILSETLGEARYAAAFRPNDTQTCKKVQSILDAIAKDGTGEKLSQQWFQKNLYIK